MGLTRFQRSPVRHGPQEFVAMTLPYSMGKLNPTKIIAENCYWFFSDSRQKIKLGKTKPKVQPAPNKLLSPGCHQGMNPVLHGLFWYTFLPTYLWTKVAQQVGASSQASLSRDPSWKTNKRLPGLRLKSKFLSSDPNYTCKPFGWKHAKYNELVTLSNFIAAGMQAGRTRSFFHHPYFHSFTHTSKSIKITTIYLACMIWLSKPGPVSKWPQNWRPLWWQVSLLACYFTKINAFLI